METTSYHDSDNHELVDGRSRHGGRAQVLVDISDIIVSEESVSALQGRQLWMRPERDVGH
ncbi:hypothetical protein [Nonomuraea zeae]|uniref:Uncharacterized protein n=1 Tax=Nonomuraea zeae TaxID=1642303 RepID=A0A5S4FCN4_9ACTN|nr:hypothetical protein [Nonomuraea zeae]TMR15051.1 hypothetical protein ETD85_56300 [Nonomuraea zeae]